MTNFMQVSSGNAVDVGDRNYSSCGVDDCTAHKRNDERKKVKKQK